MKQCPLCIKPRICISDPYSSECYNTKMVAIPERLYEAMMDYANAVNGGVYATEECWMKTINFEREKACPCGHVFLDNEMAHALPDNVFVCKACYHKELNKWTHAVVKLVGERLDEDNLIR